MALSSAKDAGIVEGCSGKSAMYKVYLPWEDAVLCRGPLGMCETHS